MTYIKVLAVFIIASLLLIQNTAGDCTFPDDLLGIWTTGKRGNLTITDEYVFNFPIDDVGTYSFKCAEQYGDRYIVKTVNTFSYAGLIFSALICFDFSIVNTNLYYYYLASRLSNTGRIYYSANDGPWNATDVCYYDPEDYDLFSYELMVRNGNFDEAKHPCPSSLRAHWAYNFNTGSGNLCPDERSLDVCQSGQVLFNYTQCSTPIAYSESGQLYCLFSVASGTETYVTLYNDDVTDESTTYRMSCWAYSESNGNLLMTQHPEVCGDYQNSTHVDMSVGAELVLFNKTVCFPTIPTDWTWLYITVGCILGFFFIVGLIVAIHYFIKYKAKQKPFRGGLEPANMAATNGHTFKLASGIPERDTPINVMQLLRKDVVTPGGRDTPSSTFDVTVKTPPQIFNIREIDSYGPSPTRETPNLKKDYHVLGGADQSEYGDLPMDDERSTKTPVMVLPLKTPGVALEENDDDYDDDDDDELIMPTPGRSSLVSTRTGTLWEDPMCPATRLPGIVEDYAHPGNDSSRVGCAKPIPNGVITNITFLNEDGEPLPPRTPTPPGAVETIRDENSKLRVKVKRRASLTKTPLPMIDEKGRGMLGDVPGEPRGQRNPERGEESDNLELVFTVPVHHPKLATGIGPAVSKNDSGKKGGRHPGALLKSRTSHLENKRGEREKITTEFSPRRDKDDVKKHSPRKDNAEKVKKQPATPRKNKVDDTGKKAIEMVFGGQPDNTKQGKKPRPKSVAGTKDTFAIVPEVEETPRPSSSVRMTRIDIPDLSPPVTGQTKTPVTSNEIIDSPPRSAHSTDSSRNSKDSSQPRKLWLDPVRPADNVWGQMSSVWRQGQAWPEK